MFRKLHSCALSFASKHSSRFATGVPWKPQGIMMSRQKELPVLPVVPLQDMLSRYVDFVEPFLTAEELEKFREVIHDFGKPGGVGQILHKLLVNRASCIPNWFSERFAETFTKSRLPLSGTAVGVFLPKRKFKTKKDQLRQLLQPEVRGTMPLDMSQYQKIFSLYRMPSIGCDILTSNAPSQKSGEHVLVIHKGQMFTFNAYDAQGVPHNESRIFTQLNRAVNMSPEKEVGVGILTAENRDVWASIYASIAQNAQNAKSLEVIKRAALVLCLDGGVEDTEPYEVAWPRQVYRGGPNAEYAANRWWDKPVQVIVGEDGGSAFLCDHAAVDGTVMAGLTNHCYEYAYSDDTRRLLYTFSEYGKNFIQSCNMSPDGYVQMALQLAAFRVIGAPVMVFGAASTRRFLHGRPDVFHATRKESVSFCKVFDSPLTSRAEKEQSFRKAVERYKQDAVLAANGLRMTRVIYGLLGIALDSKIPLHPFFKDRVFWNPHVVTSQVNLQCEGATFADPRIPDIYMVIYSIRPQCFTFGLSVSKSWPEKDGVKFKNAIEKALKELKDCVTRSC